MSLFRRKKKTTEVMEMEKEPVQDQVCPEDDENSTKTSIIFHPEMYVTPQEKYIYQYHHQQLPKLQPNQISISGIKLEEYDESLFVIAFLRNTLPKAIKFESVDLLILDEESKAVAKQTFDMDDLVELPAMSCMPWRFLFNEESRLTDKIPAKDEWKIAFELKNKGSEKHRLDLDASWEKQLAPEQKESLEKLVDSLPNLSVGEVNFMGIEAKFVQDQAFAVTVLIRNGSDKNIQLEQIPLVVEDADGEVICQGGFKLDQFEVKANTSKPWTFIFPANLVLKAEPNLTSWRVYPPNNN